VIYHILDLSTLTLNPNGVHGEAYQNVVSDFQVWYVTLAYVVAMIALGIHIDHGFWSAAHSLGADRKPKTERLMKNIAHGLAVFLTVGFLVVPLAVFFGALG
jgi:succinate dehydrogenase / fumarate reductase cytochrome b subunit